ncbi:MAG: hypothetical protein WBZ29_17510 [Methanocella sp.]
MDRQGGRRVKQKFAIALRAGLSCGLVLAVAEIAFGVALIFLRPAMNEFISGGYMDFGVLMPLATAWVVFLFMLLAVYFACGMIVAKWLAPLPIRSREIAMVGAVAGAIAEVVRSIVSVAISFALSLISPLVSISPSDALGVALENAGLRLVCGLPAFIILAAVVAGVSAYLFSIIFFRENAPQ